MLSPAGLAEAGFPHKFLKGPTFEPVGKAGPCRLLGGSGLSDKFQVYVRGRWPEFFAD